MTNDLDRMLTRIQRRQWALGDIDWDAPGADQITDEQRPGLRSFMADVTWIEQIGSRAFAALARSADDPVLAEIYRYFQAEEQRHANAELALMRRWGMVSDGEVPTPNASIRLAMSWLDRYADGLPLAVLATAIPMLEVALDGALLKFLVDEVTDPLCGVVFDRINNDESRHLAVGYHVLEVLGRQPRHRQLFDLGRTIFSPAALAVLPAGLPLMSKARDSVIDMGLDERPALRRPRSVRPRRRPHPRGAAQPGVPWAQGVREDGRRPLAPLPPARRRPRVVHRPDPPGPAALAPIVDRGTHRRACGVSGIATEVAPFTGRVLPSSTLDIDDVAPGEVVGCVGTDAAMLHVVSTLVDAGRSIKVFEDQPRRVLPRRGPLLPRRAEVLAAAGRAIALAGSAIGQVVRISLVGHHLAGAPGGVEGRSAAALRARQVRDRWTRRQLTPSRFDRRRPLRHDRYLAAVGSSRCVLVSWPIASFTQQGIRTCDGIEHRLDVLIVAR